MLSVWQSDSFCACTDFVRVAVPFRLVRQASPHQDHCRTDQVGATQSCSTPCVCCQEKHLSWLYNTDPLQWGQIVLQVGMKVLRCTILLLTVGVALAQPLERGTVPNDQYTAAPAPPPLGSEGWLTGRSTFFDGSDSFKNAYLARYSGLAAAAIFSC